MDRVRSAEIERLQLERDETELELCERAPVRLALLEDGRIFAANAGYRRDFGRSLPRCADPSQHDRLLALLGREEDHAEFELLCADGRLWMRLHVFPTEVGRGLMLEDIDALQAATEALLDAKHHELVCRMASGLAHDFNNTLAVIRANAELLEDDSLGGGRYSREQLVSGIFETIAQASRLTRQLHDLGRRRDDDVVAFPLGELLRQTAHLAQRILGRQCELRLRFETGIDEREEVRGDPSLLQSALFHLLFNAREAAPSGPITLTLAHRSLELRRQLAADSRAEPGDYLQISVCDRGAGIPLLLLPRIWQPYVTTKDPREHVGIGLSLVKRFVERTEGSAVEIESSPEQGTRVHLLLSPLPSSGPSSSSIAEPGPRGQVLLVEDQSLLRAALAALLRQLGYQVLEAEGYDDALPLLEAEGVDCLLTDVMFPGEQGGIELAAFARERWPELPIVFISGADPNSLGLPEDATFLSKPISRIGLDRTLSGVMKR